jgi:hypothetical protein
VGFIGFVCVTAICGVARADDAKTDGGDAPKKKHKKIELTGRIFTRAALHDENDAGFAGQLSLQSARGGIDYRTDYLRAQLELEVATKTVVKDAYAQLRVLDDPKLDVRAGQFKMPFSAIQLESIWTLPMADRGVIDNILTKRMQVAGRAIGAMVSADLGMTELKLGAFQGRDDAGEPLDVGSDAAFGQDIVLRGTAKPIHGIEIGASGSVRSGALLNAPIVVEHGYASEVDAVVDQPAGPGEIRAWVEGMIGTSWLTGVMIPNHHRTRFLETRAIGAYRIGGGGKHDAFVEVYALGAVLDPDRILSDDLVAELAGGISYGMGDIWRVQLEAERWMFGGNAPLGIAELAVMSTDSTTLLVQLGAHL